MNPIVGDSWEYEEEVWTAEEWTLEHFNDEYWSIIGMIRTPSTGDTRPEVVGVASEMYAQGIVDAHNAAIRELRARTANAGGEFRRDSDVNSTALLADSGGDK